MRILFYRKFAAGLILFWRRGDWAGVAFSSFNSMPTRWSCRKLGFLSCLHDCIPHLPLCAVYLLKDDNLLMSVNYRRKNIVVLYDNSIRKHLIKDTVVFIE